MFVSCDCCVLLGRGLCDELITRPGESYRLWCVVVCDLETSRMRRPRPALGRSATAKKKPSFILTKLNAAFVFIFSLYLVTFIAKTPQMYGSSCEEPWELANSVLGFFKWDFSFLEFKVLVLNWKTKYFVTNGKRSLEILRLILYYVGC